MNIGAVSNAYSYQGIGSEGTKNKNNNVAGDFKNTLDNGYTVTESSGLTLHYKKVAEDGSRCLSSWVDARSGINTAIYKPADFDENDPEYRVEIWDKNGNKTEQMVKISEVDPTNATSAEMHAYSSYLSDSGKCKSAVDSFLMSRDRIYDKTPDYDGLEKANFMDLARDMMQMQYTVGNMQGYLKFKAFYDALLDSRNAFGMSMKSNAFV